MPEGTVFFPDEPILRVTAPLPEAQLVETRLLNLLHFQTVIASKAARKVRAILDAGGLDRTRVFASGGLDEDSLGRLIGAGAPIDGFGIGTSLTTSSDIPALDCAYKLQEYAGLPRRKRSTGKATWPGRKQVIRRHDAAGTLAGDLLALEGEAAPGEALIEPVMRQGRRLEPPPDLSSLRARTAGELARLPADLRRIEPAGPYPIEVSPALRELAAAVDRRLAGG
jgi:nicotinate phosphoribosyltransferase